MACSLPPPNIKDSTLPPPPASPAAPSPTPAPSPLGCKKDEEAPKRPWCDVISVAAVRRGCRFRSDSRKPDFFKAAEASGEALSLASALLPGGSRSGQVRSVR